MLRTVLDTGKYRINQKERHIIFQMETDSLYSKLRSCYFLALLYQEKLFKYLCISFIIKIRKCLTCEVVEENNLCRRLDHPEPSKCYLSALWYSPTLDLAATCGKEFCQLFLCILVVWW